MRIRTRENHKRVRPRPLPSPSRPTLTQPSHAASTQPIKLFECRRCRLALGLAARTSAQRAHSKAKMLCLGPSGRVVWSAGRTGLALWGAYDGEFLGALSPGCTPAAGAAPAAAPGGAFAGNTGMPYRDSGSQQPQQVEINSLTVGRNMFGSWGRGTHSCMCMCVLLRVQPGLTLAKH